ncbi:hypothetical protein BCP12_168 [Bacillus phage BCP12]|uniref:Uncharacterized protein n=1 Tax=Bacillus phage BCP12 TaxID=1913122 RepID=A0A2S0CSI0_9CAUD|nr:hypothetical protein BCP12_168 [Bacillus phage BCP12]
MARITGQITISDLNDAKQYILYLNPNYKTQIYDPNGLVYAPDFTSSNLVITPELYIAGGMEATCYLLLRLRVFFGTKVHRLQFL